MMNISEGNQMLKLNKGIPVELLNELFLQFLFLINFDLTAQLTVKYFSQWHPVQMGWFTSSYCSCRSCIG